MLIYIDMDDVLCDFTTSYYRALSNNPDIKYPQSQYGFYESLAPIPGAIDAAQMIINSNKYEPYILTAPSIPNPLSYTEKRIWVEKHLGYDYIERLIISPNKALLKGDYLIDDQIKGRGQENFEGALLQFGSNEYPNWEVVLEKIGITSRKITN